ADMIERFGVAGTYRHLMTRWFRKLTGEGLLRCEEERYFAPQPLPERSPSAMLEEHRQLFDDVPFLIDYVTDCGRMLAPILLGKESPLETLFPGGSFDRGEAIYHRWALARYFNGIVRSAIEKFADSAPPTRTLRLLEVGAGTGGTTAS